MQLLHFDHKRLVLTDFRGKTIPPYAILSHRWGDSEVLFEDLATTTYKEKGGYRKIEFCAEQAAHDQLRYFWIDTCCIDKWNLRERSKAINSMFRWYQNAARCYVFLSDVSVATGASRSAWEASFRASEWFMRGWTLQELIAPVSVEFFSCEGQRIGDKAILEPLLQEITSIPLKALQNCPLDEYTILERREWAKNRETTEEEDMVYSLFGILGVFMSTAYGEGVEKAWRRLQLELEATNTAPSIIPFLRNEQFVGRESQLSELEAKLFKNKQSTKIAIVGPAGAGKSQLALEVAYRTRQKSKDCSIFWIDASDMDSLYRSYAGIAQKLGVPGWDDEKADSRQLVKAHLSAKGGRQCLLVFDNTEDVNLGSGGLSTGAAHMLDYLPQSELCSAIFTTTNSDIAKMLAPENVVELRDMTPSTAQKMLENYLNTPISTSELQEANRLLQELSCLPLAIVQAAAYIKTRNIMLQEYLSQVIRQKEAVLGSSNEMPRDKTQERSTADPVATTLLISLEQIRGDNTLAADYLFLAVCVDRKDIPLEFLEASSTRERELAVKILSSYALVTRRPAESALDLHQLVHRALRKWLREQQLLNYWSGSAIRQLQRLFPGNDHATRSKWRRLLPHAKCALSHSPAIQDGGDGLDLAWKCALSLYSDGRWREADQLHVQVMETRQRVFGDEHPDTLNSMANLASIYRNQRQWTKAKQLHMQVMETRKRVLGDEHPDTLNSMANLASIYRNQGRCTEAEQLHMQVMEIRKRVLGDEHPNTLNSIANLASTYRDQGLWVKAGQLHRHVMETRKRVLGEEHPNTLNSMSNLAFTLKGQGLVTQAIPLMQDCCRLRAEVLGTKHPTTVSSQKTLMTWQLDAMKLRE